MSSRRIGNLILIVASALFVIGALGTVVGTLPPAPVAALAVILVGVGAAMRGRTSGA